METLRILTFILLLMATQFLSSNTSSASPNSMRLLLSELRGGDYAHPGDEEAIDLVLKKIYILKKRSTGILP